MRDKPSRVASKSELVPEPSDTGSRSIGRSDFERKRRPCAKLPRDSVEQVSVASRFDSTRALLREALRARLVWLTLLLGLACTLAVAFFDARRAREAARQDFEQRSRAA